MNHTMTWADFYLICFAVGFCLSFFRLYSEGRAPDGCIFRISTGTLVAATLAQRMGRGYLHSPLLPRGTLRLELAQRRIMHTCTTRESRRSTSSR